MKILITGINGFVGSNFTKSWNPQHTLYGLDIDQAQKEGVKQIFSWEQLSSLPPIDAIVHLAGKAHDTKNQTLAESYFEINMGLTQKIFDYFLQSEAKTFIFFSSVKAAADSVQGEILTEEVVPHPIGPYGESKIKAEQYLLSKLAEADAQQKKVFILRPCMIYGEGNKGNLNLLYAFAKKGLPWFLGAYENRRSFCSINNISFVTEQLITRDNVTSDIYHVCDDDALSTNELISLISESVGKKARIWKLPKAGMNTLAKVGTFLHLPLTEDRLQKLTENYVVSNHKIKQALAITQMPFSAREDLRITFNSFK